MDKKFSLKKITSQREVSLLIVLVVLCSAIQVRNSSFLSIANVTDILVDNFWILIPALGMMCVLLIGGIDISIGSTVAFSAMTVGLIMRDHPGTPTIVLFFLAILVGACLGGVIGLVISKGRVAPIIATMGAMNIIRGATYLIAKNQWISAHQVTNGFKNIYLSEILGVKSYIWFTIICYLIFGYFLKFTTFGRQIYAVGSNPEAAEISGINIDKIKICVYSIMGALCGLSGALWISRYASAQGDAAKGMEMDVIAACVIGGVSLNGGRGSVVGVLLGGLIMAIIGNALPLINVSSFVQNALKGGIIILAVILNVVAQRSLVKSNLKRREI